MLTSEKPSENVFDKYAESYEDACQRGLALSGENRDYYAQKRMEYTVSQCPCPQGVETAIDFGCGLGHTVPYLLKHFPQARVIGVDNSPETIQNARQNYSDSRVHFTTDKFDIPVDNVDLVYCNGVFHHIDPPERIRVLKRIFNYLKPGGLFAFWENNPWNPGTRLIMSRIPFDQDAIPLSYLESQQLLKSTGFVFLGTSFHFFFPSLFKRLRKFESTLKKVPLGGQYCIVAKKPGGSIKRFVRISLK